MLFALVFGQELIYLAHLGWVGNLVAAQHSLPYDSCLGRLRIEEIRYLHGIYKREITQSSCQSIYNQEIFNGKKGLLT